MKKEKEKLKKDGWPRPPRGTLWVAQATPKCLGVVAPPPALSMVGRPPTGV
jgi:hypothetical protein